MKKLYILFFIFSFLTIQVQATHIVGGQLELTHIRGITYNLRMNLYFDVINGNPGAEDQQVVARIFSKKTNQSMQIATLYKTSRQPVNYTNPLCSIAQLRTDVILYEATIILPPDQYNEEEGYYVVWDRCCRNNAITNIMDSGASGQLFYLEFPPVVKSGMDFYNSSPTLFPPVSDYACINKPFIYDFSGKDPDGDVIVYSLSEPLIGFSSVTDPAPLPSSAPYPIVQWQTGISVTNTIPGTPALKIDSNTGILSVTPSQTGLFVFAVRCEEYRSGIKIGEVRRDFQILVIDCPSANQPPVIKATAPPGKTFTGKKGDFTFNTLDNKCFQFSISDPDPNSRLTARVRTLNFSNADFLPITTWRGTDPLQVEICFPDCPLKNGQPFMIQFIAGDDGCPIPLQDTITLSVKVADPPPNNVPTISTDLKAPFINGEFVINTTVDKEINFNITGNDVDLNQIIDLKAIGKDFNLSDIQALFDEKFGTQQATSAFYWKPQCDFINLRIKKSFEFAFVVIDRDVCKRNASDSIKVRINVEPLPNDKPTIITTIPNGSTTIDAMVDKPIQFIVQGTDPDNDFIKITGSGENFQLQDYKMNFTDVSGKGTISSPFTWTPTCETFLFNELNNEFKLKFKIEDKNCLDPHTDSVLVQIKLNDISSEEIPFIPPNVFTPNNDGISDVFILPNLPLDNCGHTFMSVTIVNRWGNMIFQSESRDFAWDGGKFPPGVYFYRIDYSNGKSYKGLVSIIY